MSKQYISPHATCPYYRSQGHQMINCDAPVDRCVLHIGFPDRKTRMEYLVAHCDQHGHGCKIADMLKKT